MPVLRRKNRRRMVFLITLLGIVIISLIIFTGVINHKMKANEKERREASFHQTPREKRVEKRVREPAVAGSWYPYNPEELSQEINSFLGEKKYQKRVVALIVPHAGYRFSGRVAGKGFSELKGEDIKRVIIIAPSHYFGFAGASICNCTHYKTPLGEIKVADAARELLENNELFHYYPAAHQREHSIEIELPFLQTLFEDFEIIPILIGAYTSQEQIEKIAKALKPLINNQTLIVVSSDFTHYGPNYGYIPFREDIPENIKALDSEAAQQILNKDIKGFYNFIIRTGATICGRLPIMILLSLLDNSTEGKILAYNTSGNITRDFSNSVSYYAIAFFKKNEMDDHEKKENKKAEEKEEITERVKKALISIARQTLDKYVKGEKLESPEEMLNKLSEELKLNKNEIEYLNSKKGCFVTLNENSRLRGCIGTILPIEKLYKCVYENTINAASHDPRFYPVRSDELNNIEIEISILTMPKQLKYRDAEDLKNKLHPLKDGVIITKGLHRATYLPQVWEQLPDKEEFLSHLCLKAGLNANEWRKGDLKVEIYHAIVFDESEFE